MNRGFKVCIGYEDKEINLPKRSTQFSAGYDFEAAEDVTIAPLIKDIYNNALEFSIDVYTNKPTLVKTGVKAYMHGSEVLYLYNRSSNPGKKGLVLANSVGVVDSDYFGNPDNDGNIMFAFYNFGSKPVEIKKGDKIGQGVFGTYLLADSDNADGQRVGGFGSTN